MRKGEGGEMGEKGTRQPPPTFSALIFPVLFFSVLFVSVLISLYSF